MSVCAESILTIGLEFASRLFVFCKCDNQIDSKKGLFLSKRIKNIKYKHEYIVGASNKRNFFKLQITACLIENLRPEELLRNDCRKRTVV